jgi:putative endonuclease
MSRKTTGAAGEKLAADFLARRGYRLVETNYRCREGEVDIIANKDNCLIFVEVRTKHSSAFGSPEESITDRKKEHLRAVAARYRETHVGLPQAWRIDVVAVELDGAGIARRIEVIENAVEDE